MGAVWRRRSSVKTLFKTAPTFSWRFSHEIDFKATRQCRRYSFPGRPFAELGPDFLINADHLTLLHERRVGNRRLPALAGSSPFPKSAALPQALFHAPWGR